MNCWNRVVQTLAATGKPVLYADFQFGGSGGFLVYTAALLRASAPNVAFVASSRIDDLVAAVKGFAAREGRRRASLRRGGHARAHRPDARRTGVEFSDVGQAPPPRKALRRDLAVAWAKAGQLCRPPPSRPSRSPTVSAR